MKKRVLSILTGSLLALALIFLFSYNSGIEASSVSDNESVGITLKSTARVRQIDCVRATEFDLPTSNPAVLDEYGIGSVLEFTDATQDISLAEFRVPLEIDPSEQPYLQLEWSCPTADPTGDVINVRWQIAYLWIAEDETTDAAAETTVVGTYNVSSTAKGLVETNIQLASMASTDKILLTQITRIGDATQDTADGVDANVSNACLYFISNKLGESL